MFQKIGKVSLAASFILLASPSFKAHANAVDVAGNDVLVQISSALSQVDARLKDHRVYVNPAKFEWKEMGKFKNDLIFTVAHDPHGTLPKDTPAELTPSYLTTKLKASWSELEVSVLGIGELAKDIEWTTLKTEMDEFFKLRDESLYQPARAMVKSGVMLGRLTKINETASSSLSGPVESKSLSVKIVDPYVEKLAAEISALNHSVLQLKEFRTPRPIENTSIFQAKHQAELLMMGGVVFFVSAFFVMVGIFLKSKFKRAAPVEVKPEPVVDSFNYYEWLKRLETSMQAIKNNEENMSEDFIKLKELTTVLSEARKGLNIADNQQEYYVSIEKLNAASPKIEEYFDKINHKKNSEASRRLVSHIIQLCEAIENKKQFSFEDEKPKLKVIKKEQGNHLKAA